MVAKGTVNEHQTIKTRPVAGSCEYTILDCVGCLTQQQHNIHFDKRTGHAGCEHTIGRSPTFPWPITDISHIHCSTEVNAYEICLVGFDAVAAHTSDITRVPVGSGHHGSGCAVAHEQLVFGLRLSHHKPSPLRVHKYVQAVCCRLANLIFQGYTDILVPHTSEQLHSAH